MTEDVVGMTRKEEVRDRRSGDAVDRVVGELLVGQSSLHDLISRYGPAAGAGLSNVLTGFRLGMIDRREVRAFVRTHVPVPSGVPEPGRY